MKNFAPKVVLAAAVALTGTASPAFADVRYYSAADPLIAWQDNVAQAQMYGRFFVEEATYLRNNTNQRDPRPGGDSIYEETHYLWYQICSAAQSSPSWCSGDTDTGPKTDTDTWYFQYDHNQLHSGTNQGGMSTHICEDHGVWAKDPCSASPTATFTY